jgi:hypothetical protein
LLIRVDPLDSVLGGARRAASSHFPVWEKAGVGEWPRRPVPRFPCPFMSSCAGSDPHPWEQRQRKADRRAAIAARMEARKAAREGSGRLAGGSRSEVWSAAATGWSPVRGPGGPWSVAQGRGGGWGVVPGSWPTGGPIHVALDILEHSLADVFGFWDGYGRASTSYRGTGGLITRSRVGIKSTCDTPSERWSSSGLSEEGKSFLLAAESRTCRSKHPTNHPTSADHRRSGLQKILQEPLSPGQGCRTLVQ